MSDTTPKSLSMTVGIPTCYGGESLINTAKSLRQSIGIRKFTFIIVADRTPISEDHQKQLKALDVELIWNTKEGSQHKKLNQIIQKLDTDLFVFTQDDITFLPDTLAKIEKLFLENPEVTMTSTRILPLPPTTWVEAALAASVSVVDRICLASKKNNHLMASGRCLAFRTEAIQKFHIPEEVVNGDMYLYLENQRTGGIFMHADDAAVYIRCPHTIKDQVGPSSRYQFQRKELKKYFDFNFDQEYAISFEVIAQAIVEEFFHNPKNTLLYIFLFGYTRLFRQRKQKVINPVWDVDLSTKSVK